MSDCASSGSVSPSPNVDAPMFPLDVLRRIASHLDIPTSLCLARTARFLQDPAESRIWRDLVLKEWDLSATCVNNFLYGTDDLNDEYPEDGYTIWPRARAARRLTRYYNHCLQSRPARCGHVRSLVFDLRREMPIEFLHLLSMVKGGLQELHISHLPDSQSQPAGLLTLRNLFGRLESPLISLRHLRVNINRDWHATVVSLLRAVPNLKILEIFHHILTDSEVRTSDLNFDTPLPKMTKLRKLVIDSMHHPFSNLLAEMVNQSPLLQDVSLLDPFCAWRPRPSNPLLLALSTAPNLISLHVTSQCFEHLLQPDSFLSLEVLSVPRKTKTVNDAVNANRKLIPPLPRLKTYKIEMNLHNALWGYHGLGPITTPQLFATRNFLLNAIPQIPSTLSLSILECPSYKPFSQSSDHPKSTFRGLLVSSFRLKESELIHCRARVPDENHCRTDESSGWVDHVRYNGVEVPVRVLAGVYAAARLSLRDIAVGRDQLLPQQGWDVLDQWILGDETWH